MTRFSLRPIHILLGLLVVAYASFFSAQLILHYYSFGSRALDLGNMDQAIWNTLHGRPFHQTNQPGAFNRLSLHVEPILLPISLLYLIYSGPETLFVLQSIVVALGAVPIFALARFRLHSDNLALVFALIYLMFPAIQGATLLDFHAVTLAPTFLLAAFYFLERRRAGLFALFSTLAVACKEDMTLLVMMLGFYALFINRQRRLGLVTILMCAGWAALAVFVIPPVFAGTDNIHWGRYDHLGETPLDKVLNLFIRPHLLLAQLQTAGALSYMWLLLAPTALIALLNPATLLLALPSFGINLLSNYTPMQEVNALIYAAPIVPAVMISTIYGLANLQRLGARAARHLANFKTQRSVPQYGLQSSPPPGGIHQRSHITYHPLTVASRHVLPFPLSLNLFLGSLLLAASFAYHHTYGYLPWGGQFRGWEEVTQHHRNAGRIFAQIPPEAALSAQDRLNPHVSQRETLYIFDRVDDADHIVLDVTEDSWPLHPVELRHRVDQYLAAGFGVVDGFDGYLLLAKNRPGLPAALPEAFFDFARANQLDSFKPQFSTPVTFDDRLELLGYGLTLGAHEQKLPVVTLYWRALRPLEHDYVLWPFIYDRAGRLVEDTGERPLVTLLWYPTSHWSPAEIIATRTLPRDLGDEFIIAVGAARDRWAEPASRLPITAVDEQLYTFEQKTWVRLGGFRRTGRHHYESILPGPVAPQQPRRVQFWGQIDLLGINWPDEPLQAGTALPFTLYWQSANPLTIDLKCFAHLLDANDSIVAQLDWTPQDWLGILPTTSWQPQRPVIDQQALALPADIPPGQYRLVVGWYYPVTGDRLPLTASDLNDETGDAAHIGEITIR